MSFSENFFNLRPGVSESAIKYSPSTISLYLVEAASLKYFANSLVYFSYRPSIGEIEFNDILFFISL